MLVAFSVAPSGGSADDSVHDAVAAAVKVVRDSGLPNRTDAMFTTIEGEWDEVFDVVRRATEAVGAFGSRVSLVLKADKLARAYDDLEARIAALAEEEELAALRPDLDGEQIMALLGLKPGPEVGAAYKYLLEVRLDEGPLGRELAEQRLREWHAARSA